MQHITPRLLFTSMLIAVATFACVCGIEIVSSRAHVREAIPAADLADELVQRTNGDRARAGLPALTNDPLVVDLARQRAESQLGNQPLTHDDPDGEVALARLLREAGVTYSLAGENLARWDSSDPQLVDDVEQALMASPEHRANILSPRFTRLAVGIVVRDRQVVVVETFRASD